MEQDIKRAQWRDNQLNLGQDCKIDSEKQRDAAAVQMPRLWSNLVISYMPLQHDKKVRYFSCTLSEYNK